MEKKYYIYIVGDDSYLKPLNYEQFKRKYGNSKSSKASI